VAKKKSRGTVARKRPAEKKKRAAPKKRRRSTPKSPRHPNGLTPKELKFVDAYFERMGNANAAARDARYAFPEVTASQLLIRPRVKEELQRRREILRKRSDDLFFMERERLRKRAGVVLTDVVTIRNGMLELQDLSKKARHEVAAVKSISQNVSRSGVTTKVTMHDARADYELVWKTEGRLLPESGTGEDYEKFADMVNRISNGDADEATGIPASTEHGNN
jgi:phage terminase small subunit